MRRLVRLYPAYWRRRYGDEFEALLREQAAGPLEAIDVVLGAFDAHVHRPGRGAGASSTKGTSMAIQLGGRAAIATGAFLLLGALLWLTPAPIVGVGVWLRTPLHDLGTLLLAGLAPLTAVVALAGLSAAPARTHRVLTWASIGLAAFGGLAILYGTAVGIVTGQGPLREPDVFGAGVVAFSNAFVVFGVAAYLTPGMPRVASTLLAAGAGAFMTALFLSLGYLYPFGLGVGPWPTIVSALPFGIGWLGLGRDALRDRPATHLPATT